MAAPRKDNVKGLIIQAAEELLKTKKLSAISLAEIAASAGISKGTLYYHYKNKDDILFDIMDIYLEEQLQDLLRWTEDSSKDTSLHRLMKYVLERDIATADMRLHFFYDAMLGNEVIRERLTKRYTEFADIIAQKIETRTQKIDAGYLAWFLLMLSDGLFVHKMMGNPYIHADKFIKQTEEYAKQSIPF